MMINVVIMVLVVMMVGVTSSVKKFLLNKLASLLLTFFLPMVGPLVHFLLVLMIYVYDFHQKKEWQNEKVETKERNFFD